MNPAKERMIMAGWLILAIAASASVDLAFAGNNAFQIIRYQVINNQTIRPLDVKPIMNSRKISPPKDPNTSTVFLPRTSEENVYKISATPQVDHDHREIMTLTLTE